MKAFFCLFSFLFISSPIFSQNKCIPCLLFNENKEEKIFVEDCCVEDTLKIQTRVSINFEYSLLDNKKPINIKSVVLHDLYIRSNNSQKKAILLSKVDKINNSFEQYIWDLCYAKVSYWYKHQPYAKWIHTQEVEYNDKLYMGATFYIIPSNIKKEKEK